MIIRRMPLFWRLADTREDEVAGIPTFADFDLRTTPDGLVYQGVPQNLAGVLDRIYQQPRSIFDTRADAISNNRYYRPFWEYIRKQWPNDRLPPHAAMDMGCGDGFLVEWLHAWGAAAIGVEIAPQSAPTPKVQILAAPPANRVFDLIVHHHVLEHLQQPGNWLWDLQKILAADGLMILAVPDCTESIDLGDISQALHQHTLYFTERSLYRLLWSAGLSTIHMRRFNGHLYATARKVQLNETPETPGGRNPAPVNFDTELARNLMRFKNRWNSAERGSIGVYCPLRAIPYLTAIDQLHVPRYFDDGMRGKWIDGVPRPIEDIEDMVETPVDTIFIMSLENEVAITDRIGRFADLEGVHIITLREILTL